MLDYIWTNFFIHIFNQTCIFFVRCTCEQILPSNKKITYRINYMNRQNKILLCVLTGTEGEAPTLHTQRLMGAPVTSLAPPRAALGPAPLAWPRVPRTPRAPPRAPHASSSPRATPGPARPPLAPFSLFSIIIDTTDLYDPNSGFVWYELHVCMTQTKGLYDPRR
jgi:hypothetical protein